MPENLLKGELKELKDELNSTNFETKKDAVKKIIAFMTVGKDVSLLFQSVLRCLEFNDIVLKKLVYLYIISCAQNKPEDAIMSINQFCKDAQTATPMIKALAVRTMGCLRIKKLNDYLMKPLIMALKDSDPYVRKTAVLCVSKVNDTSPELIEANDIIPLMQSMLKTEGNSYVMANLVQSLMDLSQSQKKNLITIDKDVLTKIMISANETIEWGQHYLLNCLARFEPQNSQDAEMYDQLHNQSIIQRIFPRLQHINPCVVISTIQVITNQLEFVKQNEEFIESIYKKLIPSLKTLVAWPQHEIQYTILKNIVPIIHKMPQLFQESVSMFYVKFDEPIYIKKEKLEIMINLCNPKNFDKILAELTEYSNEADPEFVRKSISAMGQICITYEQSTQKCVKYFLKMLKNSKYSISHITDEIVIQLQRIQRNYPKQQFIMENLVDFSKALENTVDPIAQAVSIWFFGEFCSKIANCVQIIQQKIEVFNQMPHKTQLQTLTASVKIFLTFPVDSQEFITNILDLASSKISSPDVRERAFIYWRMLSIDPERTYQVLFHEKPIMQQQTQAVDMELIDVLMKNLSMTSTIYNVKPQQMFKNEYQIHFKSSNQQIFDQIESQTNNIKQNNISKEQNLLDLLDIDDQPKIVQNTATSDLMDIFDNIPNRQQQKDEHWLDDNPRITKSDFDYSWPILKQKVSIQISTQLTKNQINKFYNEKIYLIHETFNQFVFAAQTVEGQVIFLNFINKQFECRGNNFSQISKLASLVQKLIDE